VYSCSALSVRFFAVDRALNSYFMIMIMIQWHYIQKSQNHGNAVSNNDKNVMEAVCKHFA